MDLRTDLLNATRQMTDSGLSPGTSGNLSVRSEDGFLITPTGLAYDQLTPADMAFVDMNGNPRPGERTPSSEWHFHLAIYQARPDINAVVHTHSRHCTALACTEIGKQKGLPAFHYMVAVAGGDQISCAPYATFGTPELAENVIQALDGRRACLLAHHGMIACGATPAGALDLAQEVEELAATYISALGIGGVDILGGEEMIRVIEKFKTYGQQNEG